MTTLPHDIMSLLREAARKRTPLYITPEVIAAQADISASEVEDSVSNLERAGLISKRRVMIWHGAEVGWKLGWAIEFDDTNATPQGEDA